MFKAGVGLLVAAWATSGWAADKPIYAPPSAWVEQATIPSPPADASPGAIRVLLADNQSRLGVDGAEFYAENAVQIQSPVGLQALGNIAFSWNPETDVIVIHKVHIIRGGQVIDALDHGGTFTVLRREQNLERAMLDGRLTAALQPEGLQVGDIIDFALTVKRNDPVMQGHRGQVLLTSPRPLPITRFRVRILWPKDKAMRWQDSGSPLTGRVTATAEGSEYLIDASDLAAVRPPAHAPARYNRKGLVAFSDFQDWSDVSALMAPLFVKAATIGADSPLKAEAAKIRAAYAAPKDRAAAALRLVQDKVRYLFLGMDEGGYVPAAADVTWSRLFGDCKAKTALLLALLHELGIEAEPAIVSTTNGDGMDAQLPLVTLFDHVIVRAVIDGKVYWLDGTRLGDRDLDNLEVPAFGWALPLQASGGKLEQLVMTPPARPLTDTSIRFDASSGLDLPAPTHAEYVERGDLAIAAKVALESMQTADRDRYLKEFWKKRYDFIEITKTAAAFDDATGEERLSMDGSATMAWTGSSGQARRYETDGGVLGWKPDFDRDPGPDDDAPFATKFPTFEHVQETILLPHDGAGFSVDGEDVDKTLAGFEFRRTSKIDHGTFVMKASTRSIAQEVPASQARAEQADLVALSKIDVYVQAPASYAMTPQEVASKSEKAQFESLSEQGYARLSQGDTDGALKLYNRALELEPKSAAAIANRGGALFDNGQTDAAMADFDKALEIDPRQVVAHLGRGRFLSMKGRYAEAIQAYSQALEISPNFVNALVSRGQAYGMLKRYQDAAADFDKALQVDPKSKWAIVERGTLHLEQHQLDAAAADFDKALEIDPKFAKAIINRGAVWSDLGRFDEAARMYGRAVALNPQDPLALRGRGVSYFGMKDYPKAIADFTEAVRLQPNDPGAYDRRATALFESGDSAGALADLDKCLTLKSGSGECQFRRGIILSDMKRPADARKALDASLAAEPSVDAYLARAQLRPPEERQQAVADAEAAAKLAPTSPAPHMVLAQLRKAAGDSSGELSALDDAVRLDPDNPGVRTTRGYAVGRNGQYEAGLADLDYLVAKSPHDGLALNNRCMYKASWSKDFQGALTDCNAAIRLLPNMPHILDSLAFVELRLGRYDASIRDYDAALKLAPTLAQSLFGRGIAKLRKGDVKSGQADLAAAAKIYPGVDAEYAEYGVKP
jgi:tetratricopeptide (TPR) repeat protein